MTICIAGTVTGLLDGARLASERYLALVRAAVGARILSDGKVDRGLLDHHQHAAHVLAFVAAYAETLREVAAWAARLEAGPGLARADRALALVLAAEYGRQLWGGIPMNQSEFARPEDLGLAPDEVREVLVPGFAPVFALDREALFAEAGAALLEQMGQATAENPGLEPTETLIRDQFRRYADAKIIPFAHEWHLRDALIPDATLAELAQMGVFGLTIPEDYGGSGLSKIAMCVVSEELSRGFIGAGSLGTRSEIAAELILNGGTETQKRHFLPKIASGEILPTAVFTEPDIGSDLGALRTRATRAGAEYLVTGAKTWITHAARADLMTLLVRTDPARNDYRGLSMLLAQKPRGSVAHPFPVPGMQGSEIGVIGYRGMKEYEIGFDGFAVPAENLLGGVEGEGFRHLMTTFESARIQTAARAIGVGQSALELGLSYAQTRRQFGRPIIEFPRVRDKLVLVAAELMGARQLTYFSARRKGEGQRCDLEAGMAKLLAARIAWAAADAAVQIHGGNGFAMEYPISRVLCDARILNIFEGAAEIQAQIIARRLLENAA